MEKQQLQVFQLFKQSLQAFEQENTIIGGDFNLYLNPRLDKLDTMTDTNDNPLYGDNVLSFLETENLIDIWRSLNPDARTFTWSRGKARSRLDYFLTSDHILNIIQKVDIQPGFQSDHSLLCIDFSKNIDRNIGKGCWKFNASLLHDTEYVKKTKKRA